MTTLEKQVRDVLEEGRYFYNMEMVKSIAEYIENVNQNAPDEDKAYTVYKWLKDTRTNDPKMLVDKPLVMQTAINLFKAQKQLCIDQTGCEPTIEDYIVESETDFFKERTLNKITISDLFNYILDGEII